MKEFTAKTVDEAVKLASEELGIDENDVIFTISNEKKGLLSKKATIVVYELSDTIEFAEEYVISVRLKNSDGKYIQPSSVTVKAKSLQQSNIWIYVVISSVSLIVICVLSIIISNKKREKIW